MTKKATATNKMACAGCGRYKKEVDSEVKYWLCDNCFKYTPNYLRLKNGLPAEPPLPDIKAKEILVGVNNKVYSVVSRAYKFREDWYYNCREVKPDGRLSKDTVVLGDYFFVQRKG